MATHSGTLAWKIPWTETIFHFQAKHYFLRKLSLPDLLKGNLPQTHSICYYMLFVNFFSPVLKIIEMLLLMKLWVLKLQCKLLEDKNVSVLFLIVFLLPSMFSNHEIWGSILNCWSITIEN